MTAMGATNSHRFSRAILSIVALLALLAVACGASTSEEAQQQSAAPTTAPDTARPQALAIPATPVPQAEAPAP